MLQTNVWPSSSFGNGRTVVESYEDVVFVKHIIRKHSVTVESCEVTDPPLLYVHKYQP